METVIVARLGRQAITRWVEEVLGVLPCRSHEESCWFIEHEDDVRKSPPRPEIRVDDHWFCSRRYHDPVDEKDYLQLHFGSEKSGDDYVGYDRLDPAWEDPDGRRTDSWELTRAYVKPKYRGRNYCAFLVELVLGLARKSGSHFVYAYPRHVAMLINLLDYGFETLDGSLDDTLQGIREDGKRWYGLDSSQRRLYYAEEFRSYVGETTSFLMRRRVRGSRLWDALTRRV